MVANPFFRLKIARLKATDSYSSVSIAVKTGPLDPANFAMTGPLIHCHSAL
jgi:hypothetical protein